uniref:Uncharacterized protein n=1 Tax=Aegilops tauschii subsp. strangulata TaxID=200361 RepID=A0A453GX09_AEGTS
VWAWGPTDHLLVYGPGAQPRPPAAQPKLNNWTGARVLP